MNNFFLVLVVVAGAIAVAEARNHVPSTLELDTVM